MGGQCLWCWAQWLDGTAAPLHAVGCLTEPASCRDVQQKGGWDVREGREETRASKDLHPQVSHCGDRSFWALAAVAKGGSNSPPTNKKG